LAKSILNENTYSRELGSKFWYEFDSPFNERFRTFKKEMTDLIEISGKIQSKYERNFESISMNLDEIEFKKELNEKIKDGICKLASVQFKIIYDNFKDEKGNLKLDNLKRAFEDFAQGVLYDADHDNDRTALDNDGHPMYDKKTGNLMVCRIHKMDSSGQWEWWHSFIRAAGLTFPNESKYFELDKLIAYSCMINYLVQPKQSFEFPGGKVPEGNPQNPNGPGSPEALDKAKFILDFKEFKDFDKIIKTYDVEKT
jgi:hypothetical protein